MQSASNKFDPSVWISKVLKYENYLRLMCLLFVLGILMGLSYFVYSRALYSSTALVKVKVFLTTADGKGEVAHNPLWKVRREMLAQFNSRYFQAQVGAKAGFVGKNTSYGEMREYAIPSLLVGILGDDYLQIRMTSYFPEAVRDYPKVMVEEFIKREDEVNRQYREAAVDRYLKELDDVREKLDSKLSEKLDYEENYKLAEINIEQENLNAVPVEIVRSKDRIEKMDEIRKNFIENEDSLEIIEKLSLLHRFEQLEPVTIGRMVRRSPGGSPVTLQEDYVYNYNSSTNVVVQPDMAEGLRPWQEIEKKRRILVETLATQEKTFGDQHPVITKLKREIAELEDSLMAELNVKLKSFDLEYDQVKENISVMESKLPAYHKMTREFDRQRLNYDLLGKSELAWDKAHNRLSQTIAGLEFGAGRRSAELQFAGFSSLRDVNPLSPNKKKLMMLGVVMGMAMALGVPFLIEMFDDTSATLLQLEAAAGMTGIGVLPIENQTDLENIVRSPALDSKTPHHLLEIFRVIRGNVVLHPGPSGMSQVVMVTSACPGEGKTTNAANLAWAFSSMGEKTLLVDCELRRGRVHRIAKADNRHGMTALLTGKITKEEAVQSFDGAENLSVIPRGPVVPGATEILCQEYFKELMEDWREEYDRIILDTPPVLGLSETVPLQTLADGVVMVVKADSTSKRDMVSSVDLLRKGGAHFYGMILNQIDLSKRSNHYNYFYYSSYYYGDYNNVEEEEAELLEMSS